MTQEPSSPHQSPEKRCGECGKPVCQMTLGEKSSCLSKKHEHHCHGHQDANTKDLEAEVINEIVSRTSTYLVKCEKCGFENHPDKVCFCIFPDNAVPYPCEGCRKLHRFGLLNMENKCSACVPTPPSTEEAGKKAHYSCVAKSIGRQGPSSCCCCNPRKGCSGCDPNTPPEILYASKECTCKHKEQIYGHWKSCPMYKKL